MTAMSQSNPRVVRLRFRSDVGQIPAVVRRIMSVVRQSGTVLGQEIEVELALGEALSNAVVHGNRMDPDTWVRVRCSCDPVEGVSIVVGDQGRGFDPGQVALRETGLLIMESYMDEVSFEKGGSEVRMRKDPAVARVGASGSASRFSSYGPLIQARNPPPTT